MRISGLEIKSYRSLGDEGVSLRPWSKCNILIGQNNSGKSNVIRAVRLISEIHKDEKSFSISGLDQFRRDGSSIFRYVLEFEIQDSDSEELRLISSLLSSKYISFDISVKPPSSVSYNDWSGSSITDFGTARKLLLLVSNRQFNRQLPTETLQKEMREQAQSAFNRFKSAIPNVHTIPEFRQITPGDEYSYAGRNLIGLLGQYQIPPIGQDRQRDKFERVQSFLRELLHLPSANIEITKEDELLLNNDGLRLPLSSYGTGTHELVILLTALLENEGDLYCIEEPEIHMHPRLQREFVRFITKNTSNNYLITSHSHVFVNAIDWVEDVQVFHIKSENGSTRGSALIGDRSSILALRDLGVAPSDVLMTNCTIWVEGPSDRIYIKRWLEINDNELQEGRDFSIMFYGGRLLSHLGFEREGVPEQLIHILKINQNAIVVIDSDRKSPSGGRLNQTKERVKAECESGGGICWITDGREIENLIPDSSMRRAIFSLQGIDSEFVNDKYSSFPERLDNELRANGGAEIKYASNKVKYARLISNDFSGEDIEGSLRKILEEITEKIHEWNS